MHCAGAQVCCGEDAAGVQVLSAFGQRGVNIDQGPAEPVLFVQCGQRKPKPSWSGLPELSGLRADHTHCCRKHLILLMCAAGPRYCRAQIMCEGHKLLLFPYFSFWIFVKPLWQWDKDCNGQRKDMLRHSLDHNFTLNKILLHQKWL